MIAAVIGLILSGYNPVWSRASSPGTVMIDPGHGGYDAGARGTDGTLEKDINFALARMVAAGLKDRGYRALLTRSGDYHVDIFDRTAKANQVPADLFISLHVGGGFSYQQQMCAVFYFGRKSGYFRRIGTDGKSALEQVRPYIVWEAVNEQYVFASQRAARTIQKALSDSKEGGTFHVVREERLAVLEGAAMPAVLVELGPLVNPAAEKKLQSPEALSIIADRLCRGIEIFFKADGND